MQKKHYLKRAFGTFFRNPNKKDFSLGINLCTEQVPYMDFGSSYEDLNSDSEKVVVSYYRENYICISLLLWQFSFGIRTNIGV